MNSQSKNKRRDVWTHRDSRLVLELRESGLSIRKVAEEMKCSTAYVKKVIRGEL